MLPKIKKLKKTIYLDYAAATPLDPRVKKAMEPFWAEKFANPSSLYAKGREAKQAIDESRKIIANIIGARPSEIMFTAGGTESVNLAVFGTARMNTDLKTNEHGFAPHVIASAIEHHCVINSFKALEGEGFKTTFVGVDKQGFINLDELKKFIRPETIFISIMLANNEIGTIEPIAEIGKWLKQINTDRVRHGLTRILFHTDACQAAGFLDLNVEKLGVDLMSVNGSKIYGPKQIGFLYARAGTKLKPLIYGGGQEGDLRSGTENVSGIVGLAKAFELVQDQRVRESNFAKAMSDRSENRRIGLLQSYLIQQVRKRIKGVLLNGPDNSKLKATKKYNNRLTSNITGRLLNNINFTIKGVEGEALMLYLDAYGICASTSSACSTGTTEASHVLLAIGKTEAEAKSSIRLTLGKYTTKSEINYLIKILPDIVKELRKVKKLN